MNKPPHEQVPPTPILENHDGEDTVDSTPEHHEAITKGIDELPEKIFEDKDLSSAKDPQVELLRWHYRLGHLSFNIIRAMSAAGILPKRLSKVHPPKCAACIFGKSTWHPWQTKAKPQDRQIPKIEHPGDCISVDQMESTTPGFVAQLKGWLTNARYRVATVFVDHHSGLSFVYLQNDTTSDQMVKAKKSFEAYCQTHGITVKHYHADNGCFADNLFMQDVAEAGQTISFCGVNAHFQNGVAEKCIRDLQEQARAMLLHAKARWPQAITANLWPYAFRLANDIFNTTPSKESGNITIRAVLCCEDHTITQELPHIWLSSVSFEQFTASWTINTKVGI